jgi:hypothetical protein
MGTPCGTLLHGDFWSTSGPSHASRNKLKTPKYTMGWVLSSGLEAILEGHRGKYGTPHPVAVCSCVCWFLAGQTPHYLLRTLLVEATTDQRAARVVDCPVTSIPFDRHGVVSLQGDGAERVLCPWLTLLALAPALWCPVRPPGASCLVVLPHLHAVLGTPAFLLGRLPGFLDHREPLEQGF